MYTLFLSGENLVKITFTEEDIVAMLADLGAVRQHVHALIFCWEDFRIPQDKATARSPYTRKTFSLVQIK